MFYGIEVGGVGGQKQEAAASGLDQACGRRRLVEPRVVHHDDAAGRQHGQERRFKIDVHHPRVTTALKRKRRDQTVFPRGGNDARASPPFAGHLLIDQSAPGRAPAFTVQAMIHAALVEPEHGRVAQIREFAPEQPALHLVAFAVARDFFLR